MRRDQGGTRWENLFLSSWAANGAAKKREREGPGLGLERPPLAKPTQQPTKNSTSDGADIGKRLGRGGTLGENDYPSISMAIRATKNKIKKYTLRPWRAT